MKRGRVDVAARRILCPASELSPATLTSGQVFRWTHDESSRQWRSPLGGAVFALQWAEDKQVEFAVEPDNVMSEEAARARLRDYFRLDLNLDAMVAEWKRRDPLFTAEGACGVRQLRQEPFECLMSFICSQNNNVSRIGSMIEKLCSNFGTPVGSMYSFPTITQMERATETQLRELGFGYRAPYIVHCVQFLRERPNDYLASLRLKTLEECRAELTQIKGVGLKVADCVALFSLDKTEVVPVDTHVWQIARDKYQMKECSGNKTLTPKVYRLVSQSLSDLWGPNSGWAHSLLFNTKLKAKRVKNPAATKKKRKAKQEDGAKEGDSE